jgi:hypothetical protein
MCAEDVMERQRIVRFFALKGLSPGDIHAELVSVYGADAFVLRTPYK